VIHATAHAYVARYGSRVNRSGSEGDRFDLVVVGAGSGTTVSAAAAEAGMRVAIVEAGPFGGTCLNRGCIPSKMLVHVADVARTIRRAHLFGIDSRIERIDWPAIIARVFSDIDAEAEAIEEGNEAAPRITVIKGEARFVDPKVLEVEGRRVSADRIVIAAGTRPAVPNISGLDDVPFHSSDDVMRITEQPGRLAILGGGFVAAELGHFFGSLGTDVLFIVRGDRLLDDEDDDVSDRFTRIYQRRFHVALETDVRLARSSNGEITLELNGQDGSREHIVDALLLATGRVPNTDRLAVAAAGVQLDHDGFVETDEYLRTNVDGVWALGDIVGEFQLKHSANLEAAHVAHNLLHPEHMVAVDYRAMPHAVFASPQIGSVGLTERAARAAGSRHAVARYDYDETAYGASIEDHDGFVKVLADPETRAILGCHILGTDASTLVQGVATLMRAGETVDAVGQAIFVHPALPEVVQRAFAELDV
jgi:mycothione reductase